METPICDFLTEYSEKNYTRFHMPGHKGKGFLGVENLDITEVYGADCLYTAEGIIEKSEQNASEIFDTRSTFYSTGGSSQSIKAMLYLALLSSGNKSKLVVTPRAAHQAFFSACALLDLMPHFINQCEFDFVSSGKITPENLEFTLSEMTEKPMAVFVTSPDYLGVIQDIKALSKVCKKHEITLIVDNAHGAYLRFLGQHPINLGADLCCDSAHKTLPTLTGAGYLHVSKNANFDYEKFVRKAMMIFGSTSPSYLILSSLDYCNKILSENYQTELEICVKKVENLKQKLQNFGFEILNSEPLKIAINANSIGYTGRKLAEILRENKIEAEFSDDRYLVLMISPSNDDVDFERLIKTCSKVRILPKIIQKSIEFDIKTEFAISPRKAMLAKSETINVEKSAGKICANACISCPPAIPIAVSGEVITAEIVEAFKFFGIDEIDIVI